MLVALAVVLRLFAGATYIRAVITDKAKPHIVSWFFWGLTALIAFGIQVSEGVGSPAFVTLALGLGPVVVFILALRKGLHRVKFTLIDKWCAVLTVVGILLWIIMKDPIAALWMSIAADFISSVPTVIKCYRRPHTEHALPYALSMASMVIALIGIGHNWSIATALFPMYILFINTVFTVLIAGHIGRRVRKMQRRIRKRFLPAAENLPVGIEK